MLFASAHDIDPVPAPGHLPVLLNEVLASFAPVSGKVLLDCTFGGGGHTRALLDSAEDVTVHGVDCDPEALVRAEQLRAQYTDRFFFHDRNFRTLGDIEVDGFDGVLMDLGVSSFQLDTEERGFSFRASAPVDMRLNPRVGISGAEFLETASREDLVKAIRNYGEETSWKRVVQAIESYRGTGKLQHTDTLATLIADAVPQRPDRGGKRIHPATRSFQGIRIAVNEELTVLEEALPQAFEKLKPGGILSVISFHSLEDRIVKRFFRRMAGRPEHGYDSTPSQFRTVQAELVSRKPIAPSDAEIESNPRSRSSKLRVLRKLAS